MLHFVKSAIQMLMVLSLSLFTESSITISNFICFNSQKVGYVYKALQSENVMDFMSVTTLATDKVDHLVLAVYGHNKLSSVFINMSLVNTPQQFSIFFSAHSINILYSNITVTTQDKISHTETPSKNQVALLSMAASDMFLYFVVFNIECNSSAVSSGLVHYMLGNVQIHNSRLQTTFYANQASGQFMNFQGTQMNLVNYSLMSVIELRGGQNAGALAAKVMTTKSVSIYLENTIISGFVMGYQLENGSIEDIMQSSSLIGVIYSEITVNITFKDSLHCLQGNYVNDPCTDLTKCQISKPSTNTPDPLIYVSLQQFPYSTLIGNMTWKFGFNQESGNNTDFEITSEVSQDLQNKKASLFQTQKKFFNIKITGYDIHLDAQEFSLLVLTNIESTFKCITIFFSNVTIAKQCTIYMLQQQSTISIIENVQINCQLQSKSVGKYIGLSDIIPENGSVNITNCKMLGSFYSQAEYSTLGLNNVLNNSKVLITNLEINISMMCHGGYSSVVLNNLTAVTQIKFVNLNFIVKNNANYMNIGSENGTIFGGLGMGIIKSVYTVENATILAVLYFEASFHYTGIVMGYCKNSTVTFKNVIINGGLTFRGTPFQVGMVGSVNQSVVVLTNFSVGSSSNYFDILLESNNYGSQYAGIVAYLGDADLYFNQSIIYYKINSNFTSTTGFIGSIRASAAKEGDPKRSPPDYYTTMDFGEYNKSDFGDLEKNYFEISDLIIKGTARAVDKMGVLAGEIYKYQWNFSLCKNLDVEYTYTGYARTYGKQGIFADVLYTQLQVINVYVNATCNAYQNFSYIGGLAGLCTAYIYMVFDNYTSDLRLDNIWGPSSALIGEISGFANNQYYLDWGTQLNRPLNMPIVLIEVRSSVVRAVVNPKGVGLSLYLASCIGSNQNGSMIVADTYLNFSGGNYAFIGYLWQTPSNFFKPPNANYRLICFLQFTNLKTNQQNVNCVQGKGSGVTGAKRFKNAGCNDKNIIYSDEWFNNDPW